MSANLPKQWLDRATEDLIVAQLLLGEEHFSHACFLSQQAIEKAIKALLLHLTGAYPRTHRLVDLLTEAATFDQLLTHFLADCATACAGPAGRQRSLYCGTYARNTASPLYVAC